tara:strand:+ start:1820 stop:2338 length:519 start_codon:yes stop_codon:yes gene_type:complete
MRYFIAALVVSLCWAHQDWFIWPILQGFDGEDSFLGYLNTAEHELKFGLPAGLGYQVFLSFLTAAVWLLAVWKAWPSELEQWAETGGGRGNRDRGRSQGGRNRRSGGERKSDNGGKAPRTEQKSSSENGGGNARGEGTGRRRRRRGGRGRNRGGNDNGGSGQSNGGNAPAKS